MVARLEVVTWGLLEIAGLSVDVNIGLLIGLITGIVPVEFGELNVTVKL